MTPSLELVRDEAPVVLGALLAAVAERIPVRVLLWAGAPAPVFRPSRKQVRDVRRTLCRDTRIDCRLDRHERPMHCHHEKVVIVDDEIAFVGGVDLTDLGGDRYDTRAHPARRRLGWHDVAARVEGPVVADVAAHFRMRWAEVADEALPAASMPQAAGETTLQFLRTVPERVYHAVPRGDFRILEAYVSALRGAQRLIYLESQFLWSTELVDVLARKLREPPTPDFRLLVLLPAKANNGQDDTRGRLGQLIEADGGAGRLLAATVRALDGPRADRVYVHAKVGIVDDRWLTVGSANLNEHSLFNDGECNLLTCDEALPRATRLRLWSEHLGVGQEAVAGDPAAVVDELWRPIAFEQLDRVRRGLPPTHRLIALPSLSKRAGRLRGPLVGLVDDG
jgi:phosphatidylserine/phosphatidylglycerophosphate/cardiolipin synthase-like enzyme